MVSCLALSPHSKKDLSTNPWVGWDPLFGEFVVLPMSVLVFFGYSG